MSSRVLVLTTSYPRHDGDPSGHFVESEVALLLDAGRNVRVVAAGGPRLHPTRGESFQALGGQRLFQAPGALPRLKRNPLLFAPLLTSLLRAWTVLRRAEEREWICHFLLPLGPLAAKLAKQRGAQLTLVGHGSDVRLLSALPPPLRDLFLDLILTPNTHFRFVSEELRDKFVAIAGDHISEQTSVEPCALAIPPQRSKESCRRDLGLPLHATIAVIVGRVLTSKRVRTSLEALSLVEGTEAIVVGDGPLRKELEADFPDARFVGAVTREAALQYIRAADLLVSASLLEGSPTAIREALALGATVVARGAGDLALQAKTNSNLWLVDERKPARPQPNVGQSRSPHESVT